MGETEMIAVVDWILFLFLILFLVLLELSIELEAGIYGMLAGITAIFLGLTVYDVTASAPLSMLIAGLGTLLLAFSASHSFQKRE